LNPDEVFRKVISLPATGGSFPLFRILIRTLVTPKTSKFVLEKKSVLHFDATVLGLNPKVFFIDSEKGSTF